MKEYPRESVEEPREGHESHKSHECDKGHKSRKGHNGLERAQFYLLKFEFEKKETLIRVEL